METTERPWGEYTVLLDAPAHKVKQITVNPGKRLSLQSHFFRSEYWVIVSGYGRFTLGASPALLDVNEVNSGDTVDIFPGELHRIECTSTEPLVFIETQLGRCDEEDIVRYEDDWNRT